MSSQIHRYAETFDMHSERLFEAALGVDESWFILETHFEGDTKSLTILVDFKSGSHCDRLQSCGRFVYAPSCFEFNASLLLTIQFFKVQGFTFNLFEKRELLLLPRGELPDKHIVNPDQPALC